MDNIIRWLDRINRRLGKIMIKMNKRNSQFVGWPIFLHISKEFIEI